MQNIMLCPVSVTCEIAPEYEDVDENNLHVEYTDRTTTLLTDDEEIDL